MTYTHVIIYSTSVCLTNHGFIALTFAVDALFAVYEASSLELWFFMDQAAMHGGTRTTAYVGLFYVTLVFFLVFVFQVCLSQVKCAVVERSILYLYLLAIA